MKLAIVFGACVVLTSACGSSSTPPPGMGAAGNTSSGGAAPSGGAPSSSGGASGSAPVVTAGAPPVAMGTPGVWEKVTSPDMDPELFTNGNFGIGSVVTDPKRPNELYVGGYGSLWKSIDYGLEWSKVDSKPNPESLALGHVVAVAGTTPATVWMASANGAEHVYKSTDAGLTFTLTGAIPEQPDAASLYSIVVDPNDATHLISGLHEQDKLVESIDGGATWKFVSGTGWVSGGKSWFPFFIDTGDAATTRNTWFAIAQDGASASMTSDGGKNWAKPKGVENLTHPHGVSGLYQSGKVLMVAGLGATAGDGIYRSNDLGLSWTRVAEGRGALVWGSAKTLYSMWGWACGGCGLDEGGPELRTAPQPGDTWTKGTVPDALDWGPNSVATTSDGNHAVYVGSMWATGLWRFVEP